LNYSGIDDGINSSSQIGSKVNEMRSDSWVNSDATYLPQSTPPPSSLSILQNNTMRIKSLDDPNIFSTPAKPITSSSLASIQVIGVIPGQLITQKRVIRPKVNENYQPLADTYRDIAKLAVIERHHKTGNIGLGFIQGLGLKTGAIVSSVAHDSHNLVVAGMNDMDMLTAAKHISLIGGGLAVVDNCQVIASLPLPIAGLMSDQNISSVISNLTAVNEACRRLGDNIIKDPFMLLSFMSLPVIPSLKLTDKGLVDVDRFEFTNLWVD
jgi:adenine deaminase